MSNAADRRKPVLEFWDPHFHIWDITENAALQSGVEPAALTGGTPGDDLNYRYDRLLKEFAPLNGEDIQLKYIGGCFVEAMSVCHPQTSADDLNPLCLQEARWAERELPQHFFFCPSVQLHASNAEATLSELAKVRHVRGIRQILNYRLEPASKRAPRCSEDFLQNPTFLKNFGLLATHDLHFECQLEAPQFEAAVKLFRAHPNIPVVINHLGSPHLPELEDDKSLFWKGMRAFASLPHCSIKISMLCRIHPDWDTVETVEEAVHTIIQWFGPTRCFFASNFPVDSALNWPAKRLFPAFRRIAARYPIEEQMRLFWLNAQTVYRATIFKRPEHNADTLQAALDGRDIAMICACHSRATTIQTLTLDGRTKEFKGHVGVRKFYTFLFKTLGEDDIFWSSLPNTKQCTIHARIAGATEIAAVETNSFDSENYVCSKTVVLHGAQW